MDNIIYTGSFRFPDKDAASLRVLGIAKALRDKEINTIFCGWEYSSRNEDLNEDGVYRFDNFEYYSQSELDLVSKNVINKIYHFFFLGRKTVKWIKKYLKTKSVSSIIVYNSNSIFILSMYLLSKKYKFKLICDCTEWYEGSHLPGGKFGVVNLDNNIRIRIIYPLIKNVIVISSYLEIYLQKRGCNTILVPPLVDFTEHKWNIPNDFKIPSNKDFVKIIYAGDPGKKDILTSIFKALEIINNKNICIEFTVLGVDKDIINKTYFSELNIIPNYINCIARVNQKDVPLYYRQSHFSILLRENKRYAYAGFPTKLVESLCSGIPIITNRTSDIPKFIINGENGLLLWDNSTNSLIDCFKLIMNMTYKEISDMHNKALISSTQCFDFKLYSNILGCYLKKIV